MAEGKLKAVVCTATLDLGIDWGDVDLVVNVGAPKGASRIMQRIGRSNHRMDEPSKAYLVPANRFEILECRAALDAVHEAAQDTPDARIGALDVLCQHVLGMACAEPFAVEDALRGGALRRALSLAVVRGFRAPSSTSSRPAATRCAPTSASPRSGAAPDGLWRVRDGRVAQQYRMNVGTIIESTMPQGAARPRGSRRSPARCCRAAGGCSARSRSISPRRMTAGDTFMFAGEVLRFEGIHEDEALVTRAPPAPTRKIPSYAGGKFPLSTFLAERVRGILADPFEWDRLPPQVVDWLLRQRRRSRAAGPARPPGRDLPARRPHLPRRLSLRGPPRAPDARHAAHPPPGAGAACKPLGFVANDYGLAVWACGDLGGAGAARARLHRRALRRGHARRRPRGLARRIGADEAHLPLPAPSSPG